MERIKVNVEGDVTVPSVEWEKGWQMVEDLLWAKQSEEVDVEEITGKLHVPVARPSAVKVLDRIVEVDDSLVQFEDREVMKVLNDVKAGPWTESDLAQITTNPFSENSKIVDLECLKYMTSFSTNLAIKNCENLQNIALPRNWSIFGSNGTWTNFWYNYNLKRIDFSNVTELANVMFQHSTKVEEVVIKKLQWVGNKYASTFTFPSSIERVVIGSIEQFLSIQYPNSAQSNPCHGGNATLILESTPLTSITIPSTLTQINAYALYNLKTITSISYEGTIEQWISLPKGTDWHYNVPVTEVTCSDGICGIDETI